MIRCQAYGSRQRTQRIILDDGTHSSVTGKLFNETVNVRINVLSFYAKNTSFNCRFWFIWTTDVYQMFSMILLLTVLMIQKSFRSLRKFTFSGDSKRLTSPAGTGWRQSPLWTSKPGKLETFSSSIIQTCHECFHILIFFRFWELFFSYFTTHLIWTLDLWSQKCEWNQLYQHQTVLSCTECSVSAS